MSRSPVDAVSSKPGSNTSPFSRPLKMILLVSLAAGLALVQFVLNASDHKVESGNSPAQTRLSESVTARLTNNGNRRINFAEGRDLLTNYLPESSAGHLLLQSGARPLALASDDFDEDGVPDLVCSYSSPSGGLIAVHRGNVDSIYPNSPAAKQRRLEGTFTDAPFLSSAIIFEAPVAGDLIGAGDFDADGHRDLVVAARDQAALYFFRGDGSGNLRAEKRVDLNGEVTAMATGEVNLADSLADIVVGITNANGSKALVFESPDGAMRAEPEHFDLPAQASSIALGELDGDSASDIALAAGRDLIVVRGRDRKFEAKIDHRKFDFSLRSIIAGDFIGDSRREIALLGDDGSVHALGDAKVKKSKPQSWSLARLKMESLSADRWPLADEIVCSRMSSLAGDTILVLDSLSSSVGIVEAKKETKKKKGNESASASNVPVELQLESAPVAILPMRLNRDAITDLVVLQSAKAAPVIIPSAPTLIFTVGSNGDGGDNNPGNGVCDDGGGNCTLRAAIQEANASLGPDAIEISIGAGAVTIAPASDLDLISETLTIDGTTQPGFVGAPIVELSGAGALADGLILNVGSGNSTIRGLVINNFTNSGTVAFTNNNLIEGNFIGTDLSGTVAIANDLAGVLILNGATANTIGGTVASAANVISGNNSAGVQLINPGTNNNTVQGNLIGTDVTGAVALPNLPAGVLINQSASNNLIGGPTAGARNILSGNAGNGAQIVGAATTGNLIQGNFIGTDMSGANPVPNQIAGVRVFDSIANTIGGASASAGNLIAFNTLAGVQIISGTNNSILSNPIFENGALGIELADDGVTPNDSGDADSGPNNLQNFPVITLAETSGSVIRIQGTLNTTPGPGFRLQFFSNVACDPSGNGEGQMFIGSTVINNLAAGPAAFNVILPAAVSLGSLITATATDPAGNTSEFSACVTTTILTCGIFCPANQTVFTDPASTACSVPVDFSPDVAGDCGTIICTPPPGSLFNVGMTQVNCVTELGLSCSFEITVLDTTPPLIVCPENVTGTTSREQQTSIVNYPAPTVTDNCLASLISCNPPSGSAFPPGATFVSCLARDDAGNEASCTFAVVVGDGESPMITCPAPVAIEIPPGQTSVVVTYPPPVVSDNFPGATVTCLPPSGAIFPLDVTTITCTAVDARQNRASCSFSVSVNGGTPTVRVDIESGEPVIEFGGDTPVNPTRRPPRQPGPCGLFTVENTSRASINLTFAEAVRTGEDVDNGRIANPSEGGLYSLSIVDSDGSEAEVPLGGVVTIDIGEIVRFCLRFTPLFPRVLANNQNVPATAVMPDVITSRVRFDLTGGQPVFIDVNGQIDDRVVLINPDDPRQSPVVRFTRSGDEITITYSVYDPNLNVVDATYEMLNSAGQVVETLSVNLASALTDADLIRGQSFTVDQRFTGAQTRPEIVGCRVTVRDGETSVTRVSQSLSATQSATVRRRASGNSIAPRKLRLARPFR